MKMRKGRAVPQYHLSRAAGFEAGRSHGYRTGFCQSALAAQTPPVYPVWPLRVLFIRQGFEAIDRGISEALASLVREPVIGDPADLYRLAAETRPDLVIVMNGLHVFPQDHLQMVTQVKELGIPTAIWFADDPYFTDWTPPIARHYDYVFTHELSCLDLYREAGCQRVYYLPLAASPAVYHPLPVETKYQSDICFIGNAFPNRLQFFNQIMPFLTAHKTVIIGALWNNLTRYNQLARRIKLDWTPVDETVKYYNGAKIVINLHRGAVDPVYSKNGRMIEGRSINPRTYEIAACGSLQMTDLREDLPMYYAPGADIITYSSPAEFVDKAHYYLVHEQERITIGARAMVKTVQQHTFQNRLNTLFTTIFPPSDQPAELPVDGQVDQPVE